MKKVEILFGEMSFDDDKLEATVYKVEAVEIIDEDKAADFAEEMLLERRFTSYLIPEIYKGKIIHKIDSRDSL